MDAVAGRLCCPRVICLVIVAAVGCGRSGPKMHQVQGTVSYQGKPLPLGLVTFVSNSYRPTSALIDANGRYELEAIPGENKIEVVANAYVNDGKPDPPTGVRIAQIQPLIPAKYNHYHTSGVVVNVEAQPMNEIDIHLK